MKKVLLIVALIATSYGLKAQTLVKPMDSLLLKAPQFFKNIKPDDNALMKQYFVVPPSQKATPLLALAKPLNTTLFASRMPILKVESDDKMPVAKMGSDDKMPVLKVMPVDPLKPLPANP